MRCSRVFALALGLTAFSAAATAQITKADYERANSVRQRFEGLLVDVPGSFNFIEGDKLWYRKSVAEGDVFVLVDAVSATKAPAFDHVKLAESLSAETGEAYTATTLPFRSIEFISQGKAIQFEADEFLWTSPLTDCAVDRVGPAPERERGRRFGRGGRGRRGGPESRGNPYEAPYEEPAEFDDEVFDGIVDLPPRASAQRRADSGQEPPTSAPSPDGQWEAYIEDHNVYVRPADAGPGEALSTDGSEGDYYTFRSLAWSPNSASLVAYRVRPGYTRLVHYIESAPRDQSQPRYSNREYRKPGDAVDLARPVLFHTAERQKLELDNELFPNPYSLSRPVWRADGRGFTFEYNQRGHQVYRVIEVDAASGRARAVIDEEPETFFSYRRLDDNPRSTGSRYRHDLDDGREIIWCSERDGWRHLYLYDGVTGKVKNQITRGDWVVRAVDRIDEEARHIWFSASGMNPDQDPYFRHSYRINFDGTELVTLTAADGDHRVTYSEDGEYYVDTWSRVDLPPVSQLRRTEDQGLILDLETGDMGALLSAGWRPPEVFTAKGRDGQTDIWGIIMRPTDFDPDRQYPVIESIYAGPHGSFVPKTFRVTTQPLAELGFIIAQIDGMGTNNRSKAFHDVAWKNLGDAGLPDRILWHQAVAEKYPYYDISRVGIYGTSAGGQSALGALLFHGDFYKAAVANCGCHDNRMDKIWWNEQWMGWPIGDHYSRSSNVDNAYRLQGSLLLVVGEMDSNVDPSSTLQVVDELIRNDKDFDLLFVPGGGHGAGGALGRRVLYDFFVHELLGEEPPDWNKSEPTVPDGPLAQEPEAPSVPSDLRPLLSSSDGKVHVVAERYDTDREQLDSFYRTPLSTLHLARLKRFDMSWSAALGELDPQGLDADDEGQLRELKDHVQTNLAALEAEAAEQAHVAPLVPFATEIQQLMEARRRLDPIEPQAVAATLTAVAQQIERLSADLGSGVLDVAGRAPQSAEVVDDLRAAVRRWFDFYDGYDPMFTWWVAQPYAEFGDAISAYAGRLREQDQSQELTKPPAVTLEPASPPPISEVPDLASLLHRPHNELRGILQAYTDGPARSGGSPGADNVGRDGRGGGRGRRRGRRGSAPRTELFYTEWLTALEALAFDSLSRPARVSYLGLRNDIEVGLVRLRTPEQEDIPTIADDSGIEGRPVGRTALMIDLEQELIPYTPEELIALGDAEYAWCLAEMLEASRELGYGEDWRAALEHVKTLHVPPGGQPVMIRGLMFEAVDFLREHDLITVPQIASETLRMRMMSPQRQAVNPFFTGGSQISVSFPTDSMSHEAKLQSMRGNNIPLARATVHHELIPGHNHQGFVNRRYSAFQAIVGRTPFYSEGWAVYFEMLLYGMEFPRITAERTGFPSAAENRIGFLFWRMHRSARITFSLRFHMGEWSAQQCIDFLVDGVGHERENAIAEVRRSFGGSYSPLYQAAYLLGAVQFRELHEELVEAGRMSEKDFHDEILRHGNMPVALVRLLLNGEELSPDMSLEWKFYGETIADHR